MQSDDLAYFDSEEFRTILNQYEESVESEHPIYIDADDLADIADYYQYNGFPEKAKVAVDLALEYNPEAVGPLLFKAREALVANDFETAREYAEKIEAVDTMEAVYLKGEILVCQFVEDALTVLIFPKTEQRVRHQFLEAVRVVSL